MTTPPEITDATLPGVCLRGAVSKGLRRSWALGVGYKIIL